MPTDKTPDELREEQIARMLALIEKRLRKELPDKLVTIDEIERIVERIGEGAKQDIQQDIVDGGGTGHDGKELKCACGGRAQHKRTSERCLITLHGEMVFRRAYYWCPSCRHGWYPLDDALGVPRSEVSVSVRALACRFVSLLPYRKAAHELEVVCGIRLSVSTLQRIAGQTGGQLAEHWRELGERVWAGTYEPKCKAAEMMHVSMDGVMAHVGGRWREVKLGVCYQLDATGPMLHRYTATLKGSLDFGKQLRTCSTVAGADLCKKTAVLADGSDWIWQEAGKHYTTCTHILDFFHVTEHLWLVARSRFADDNDAAHAWVHKQKGRLLERDDGATRVIGDIRNWQAKTTGQQEVRRLQLSYLRNHSAKMRYKRYADAGYQIGSGVMESSCRWVVQQRMKSSGMRWQEKGATAMLYLRTAWCSNADIDMYNAARKAAFVA